MAEIVISKNTRNGPVKYRLIQGKSRSKRGVTNSATRPPHDCRRYYSCFLEGLYREQTVLKGECKLSQNFSGRENICEKL